MFTTLDTVAGAPKDRSKSAANRACDQCKLRKVRCEMSNPCTTCVNRNLTCTYNEDRKKRGPVPGRISKIQNLQRRNDASESVLDFRATSTSPSSNGIQTMTSTNKQQQQRRRQGQAGCKSTQLGVLSSQEPNTTDPLPLAEFEPSPSSDAVSQGFPTAQQVDFLLPSLPIDSPSGSLDLFASIAEQDLPPISGAVEFWPRSISQEAMLPWIDVYFKRLHPTVPVLNRTMIYQEMLLHRHHHDPQFGAMLLALCAFAMTQPVQIHEAQWAPSRSAQARMLLEESVKMRTTVDFGETPSLHMILTSFFIFACLFGTGLHKAAHHRLREAVDLAHSLCLHLPQAYDGLDAETREQWLRTYLVLSVTERAYALQKHHSIGFRGSPAVNAFFMRALDSSANSPAIVQDNADLVGMTGLLYLMETFDAIDESVVECWIGFCKFSDGCCESFDRRRAIQMFRAQHRVREACLAGNMSLAPPAASWPLDRLLESQQADVSITQFWLLNRLWNLCLSHGLLREVSDHAELRFDFAYHIASALVSSCDKLRLTLPAMEVHGIGLVEKVYDVAMGVTMPLNASSQLMLESRLKRPDSLIDESKDDLRSVKELLQTLNELIRSFRGGDHEYTVKFATELGTIPD